MALLRLFRNFDILQIQRQSLVICSYSRINTVSLISKGKDGKRFATTHRGPRIFPNIECSESAHKFVKRLDEKERTLLLSELTKQYQETSWSSQSNLFLYQIFFLRGKARKDFYIYSDYSTSDSKGIVNFGFESIRAIVLVLNI